MFGIKTKRNKPLPTPQYVEARSYGGSAFHIIDTTQNEQGVRGTLAICGYSNCLPTNTVMPVGRDKVFTSWERQHAGWHWCNGCVVALFELDIDAKTERVTLDMMRPLVASA